MGGFDFHESMILPKSCDFIDLCQNGRETPSVENGTRLGHLVCVRIKLSVARSAIATHKFVPSFGGIVSAKCVRVDVCSDANRGVSQPFRYCGQVYAVSEQHRPVTVAHNRDENPGAGLKFI